MSDAELWRNRSRAGSFGDDADRYDRTRPSYPDELLDELLSDGATDVLDVGCGTGIVSRLFAGRGCRVLGVEHDARMAEVARGRGTDVEVGDFERWDAAGRTFDLLVAGQAWHWIDPVLGSAKAAEVLRAGGRIGLFWNWADPDPALRTLFDAVYHEHAPELADSIVIGSGLDDRFERAKVALEATGSFTDVRVERWWWSRTYTTDEWIDLVPTHSDHQAVPRATLDGLLEALRSALDRTGGGLTLRYRTTLVTGARS